MRWRKLQGVACPLWAFLKSTTWSKTYKKWALRSHQVIWLRATLQRGAKRSWKLQKKCTREQTPWHWPFSRSASPSPGWRPEARSPRSSPSSRLRLRPPPCAPTCPSGQRSAALGSCTPLKSACTSRRQRRTRPSAGWWSCAWWCCGRSTPRSPAPRRRWPPLTSRAATARVSPSSQLRRGQTFTAEPNWSQSQHPAPGTAAQAANRWCRASPAPSRRRRRRAAGTSSRGAAPGRATWWLYWCTIDLAATARSYPSVRVLTTTKSGVIPEQLPEGTDAPSSQRRSREEAHTCPFQRLPESRSLRRDIWKRKTVNNYKKPETWTRQNLNFYLCVTETNLLMHSCACGKMMPCLKKKKEKKKSSL